MLQGTQMHFPGLISLVTDTNVSKHSRLVAYTNTTHSESDTAFQNRIERDKAQILKTCKKYGLNRQFAKGYKVPQFRGKYKWIQEKHIGWCLQSKVSDFM